MHTVWKGAISFGLVHVPVKMFSATEDKDIAMRYIHKTCITPLSYVRKCATCETEVDWEEIAKGYEYEPGRFVLFDKEELEELSGEASKEIKILDFVDLTDIDPVYFQKTYYLAPAETGAGAYTLLLESMLQTGKIGVAKVSIRSKSSLAAIRVIDRCLAMETIFYPDEIRPISQVPNLPEGREVNERELEMAKMLIGQLSGPFEPAKYKDEHRSRVLEAIERKVAGEEVQAAPEPKRASVVDLMAALQASLDAMKPLEVDAQAEVKPPKARGRKSAAQAAAQAGAGAGAATSGALASGAAEAARAGGAEAADEQAQPASGQRSRSSGSAAKSGVAGAGRTAKARGRTAASGAAAPATGESALPPAAGATSPSEPALSAGARKKENAGEPANQ
ncbi:Ku protein [Paenibacillus athensensis]|uniref:Non-homologous end joining protein Ku n=1 Tax=Paenibacillus athensensis TaxID=1967502 RepID=A0A4Y8Q5B4_9BACL|nr:Ku protein [Paenibacillus athensensis]